MGMKRCDKCGELKSRGNFFKDGPFCGHCWMEQTPDWFQQLMRDARAREKNEADKVKRKHDPIFAAQARYYSRRWERQNPEKARAAASRRRSRKCGLASNFTADDESRALSYWDGRCAVCGRPLNDLFGEHTAAMDHWIALSDPRPDNPGTVPKNMVPLCHGVDGCNNKKHNADPAEWLEREFGKLKAAEILGRIEAYFEWVIRAGKTA